MRKALRVLTHPFIIFGLLAVLAVAWTPPWRVEHVAAQSSVSPGGLGFVTVTSAGTPVQFTSSPLACVSLRIQPRKNSTTVNVGNIYIGNQNMVKSTGAGVYAILSPEQVQGFSITAPVVSGVYPLSAYNAQGFWIDADNSGDAALVGCLR